MIENSIQRVITGTNNANDTAVALNKIVDGINNVSDIVENIASASSEQADEISQINKALGDLANVVQTNNANSEEGAASSQQLASQAQILNESICKFKLNKDKIQNNEGIKSQHKQSVEKISTVKQRIDLLENKEFGKY
jgi:methyl-accepting chemotaxis protein